MGRVGGKRILVTAAGQGIGAATARLLRAEGAEVIATDLRATDGIIQLDVTDSDRVLRLAAEVGVIDGLFNCAGFIHNGTILECDEQSWDFSFNLNVKGMYRMTRAFLPNILDRGQGAIVNMSSVASSVIGVPNRFVYGTTKAAVIGLTKAIAADFVTSGIRCNAICPGTVQSPSLDQRMADTGDLEKAKRDFVARQPMGRIGEPEEVAELAVYLLSDASAFTTGQIHVIDGGWSNS